MRVLIPALPARLLLAVGCLLAGACGSERSAKAAEDADEARAVVTAATAEHFAELLRAQYAAHRACTEQRFPATVNFTSADTTAGTPLPDVVYARPFELLRAAGLAVRDEMHPGDADWPSGSAAYVRSPATQRIVRYTLTKLGRENAEADAKSGSLRVCYARPRLVSVDSVVMRGLSPSWTAGDGVRYSQAESYVLHTVAFDSVAPWTAEVGRRDTLQSLGELHARLLEGPQRRWAEFWVRDGDWKYVGTRIDPPR